MVKDRMAQWHEFRKLYAVGYYAGERLGQAYVNYCMPSDCLWPGLFYTTDNEYAAALIVTDIWLEE